MSMQIACSKRFFKKSHAKIVKFIVLAMHVLLKMTKIEEQLQTVQCICFHFHTPYVFMVVF